jgi:hypothetical protein
VDDTTDFTAGMSGGDIENWRMPNPNSTQVKSGSPAISPQIAIGFSSRAAPSIASFNRRSTAGWRGWYR